MTNQTIPPCPLCGTVPKLANQQLHLGIVIPRCVCLTYAAIDAAMWQERCMYEMHNALHELGIETVEKLNARLAPDPRVAVLEIALTKVAESDLSQVPYSQIKAHIEEALFRSQFIAAQRGEVDG